MSDYGHDLAFGVFLTPTSDTPHQPVRLAQLAEEAGLDLASFQDHPYHPGLLDAWTLLTWVAASTERIGIAGNVHNLPLRPPAVLARAATSLDLLSGGRVSLGLGAGGFWDAIESMGATRLTPGESVQALEEGIGVIRGLWDAGNRRPLRVHGEHHRVDGAKRGPAPAHDIPIWVGAYKPRMLRLVGRLADGWLPSQMYLEDGDLRRGNAVIDDAAREAGRDPSQVRRLLNVAPVTGSTQEWVDTLVPLALEDGIGTFIAATDDPRVIERLGQEVAPAVREAVAERRRALGTVPASARRGSRALGLRRDHIDYDGLPPSLAGRTVEPGDRGYDALRHNYLRSGRPGLILRPQDVAETSAAVLFARDQEVPLGIRSGRHGVSGRSTNDGGVVVDLAAFDGVEVLDEATRRVRVGAGATWKQVANALAPRGWAITSGDHGGVGVGGLATTAGIGLLGRSQGLTIDHVVAADLVSSDGRAARASATENPDLFWGLRGAGGNLGVVTSLELEVEEVGDVVFSTLVFDASDTADFLTRWGEVVSTAPRQLTSFMMLGPGRPGYPPMGQVYSVWADDDTEAAVEQLQRLAAVGPLLQHQATLMPYADALVAGDGTFTGGGDPVVRSTLVRDLDAEVSAAFAAVAASEAPYVLQIRSTGGATNDVAPDATAYAHRHQNFLLTAMGKSHDTLDPVWDARMGPHADGLYLSFDTDLRPERLTDAFPTPTLTRLRALKREWDPANIFRANFPIPPADA